MSGLYGDGREWAERLREDVETANRSDRSRPVLVVAADAPDGTNSKHHDLQITHHYEASLPVLIRDHLTYRLVDELEFVVQHHKIQGLLEPDY